jgi:hypothetical protein
MELERAEQAYGALGNHHRDLGQAPLRRQGRVRMGIEAARHAHQGAPIRESLHVLPRQAEPSQVARARNAEAPHRFECFSFEGIFHGSAYVSITRYLIIST